MQKEFGTWNFIKCLKKEFVPQNRSKLQKGIAFQFLEKEFVPFGTNSCPALHLPNSYHYLIG